MKTLLSLLLLLGSAFTVYADYPAESYGADPSLPSNTLKIQAALDAAGIAGGGIVTITNPGVYLLQTQGANPYTANHKYCLEVRHNNITLSIGQGVTLKLANGQQTTSPVDIIIFNGKSNLVFTGASNGSSVITGNTAGQPWAGGYAQIVNGIIISGTTSFVPNQNIRIQDLTLQDHFSNPINFTASNPDLRSNNVHIERVRALNCGEGIQVIHVDDVWIKDCYVDNPVVETSVGDGIEVANVTRFHITGSTARNQGGSGFDIFASRNGIVQDFIAEGCTNGIAIHPFPGAYETENVLVDNGLITAPQGAVNSTGVELLGPTLKNITVSRVKVLGTPHSYGFVSGSHATAQNSNGTVRIVDCEVSGAKDGMRLNPISDLTIRGGSYSNNVGRGIVLLYVATLTASDVANLRIDGVDASNNGGVGILIDSQGNQVPLLAGSIINCVLNNTAGPMSIGPESANLVIKSNIPIQGNPRYALWK